MTTTKVRCALMPPLPEPTPEAVRAALKATGLSTRKVAVMLGVAYSGLRKNAAEDDELYQPMSPPTWALLLLLAGQHPDYVLMPRPPLTAPISEQRKPK